MKHSQRRNGAIVQGVFDSPQLPCHYLTVAMGLDVKVKIEEYILFKEKTILRKT